MRVPADTGFISTPTFYRTDHFSIVSERDAPAPADLGTLLEAIHSRLSQAMASYGLALEEATEPLVWVCFDDREQYRRYAQDFEHANPAFRDAYYSTRTNQVVLCCDEYPEVAGSHISPGASPHLAGVVSGTTVESRVLEASSLARILLITHEMTHQLVYNCGLQKRGVMYPLWVSEGLATFFEGCVLPAAGRAAHDSRKRRLAELGSKGKLLPLDKLAVLTGPDALGLSPADVYAQCWGLLHFLLGYHSDRLSSYLADLAQAEVGRRSSASLRCDFVGHFGPVDALDSRWRDFVASLSRPEPTAADPRFVTAEPGL
jgi:hypothetical protein